RSIALSGRAAVGATHLHERPSVRVERGRGTVGVQHLSPTRRNTSRTGAHGGQSGDPWDSRHRGAPRQPAPPPLARPTYEVAWPSDALRHARVELRPSIGPRAARAASPVRD